MLLSFWGYAFHSTADHSFVPQRHAGGFLAMVRLVRLRFLRIALISAVALLAASCDKAVEDEATRAGLTEANFPQADEDYFRDMDNAVQLDKAEIQGRNMWLVWSGGNDRFWDGMSKPTLGGFDLL